MKACSRCGHSLEITAIAQDRSLMHRLLELPNRWGYYCPACQTFQKIDCIGYCYACRRPLDLEDLHTPDQPQGATLRIVRRWDYNDGVVAAEADYYHLDCYNYLPVQPLDAPLSEVPFPLALMILSMTSLSFFVFSGNIILWILRRSTLP